MGPVQHVDLKTERFAMAFRLPVVCTFICKQSEQKCSHCYESFFVQAVLYLFDFAMKDRFSCPRPDNVATNAAI
jgi:hypothetical protein